MTIIRHYQNWHHRAYAYRDHIPHPDGCFQSEAYVCGDLAPHFPVPAIPLRCDIWHDMVIWSQHGTKTVSGYFSHMIRRSGR